MEPDVTVERHALTVPITMRRPLVIHRTCQRQGRARPNPAGDEVAAPCAQTRPAPGARRGRAPSESDGGRHPGCRPGPTGSAVGALDPELPCHRALPPTCIDRAG